MSPHIQFVAHGSDREVGAARLVDGRLVSDTESVQTIVDGKVRALDLSGPQAVEYFASWSNGYIGSSVATSQAGTEELFSRPTTTIGIDLSATPVGTAIVGIDWAEHADAHHICDAVDGTAGTDAVLRELAGGDKVGVDCPFGWPEDFVDAVVAHRSGEPWPAGPDMADRRPLRLRATDRHVADEHGVNPLSVSTDRIGSVAMRWAATASRHEQVHGPIDRTGAGRIVEVYPAVALRAWKVLTPGTSAYKKRSAEGVAARVELVRLVQGEGPRLRLSSDLVAAIEHPARGHDVLDALVAALTAAAAATPDGIEDPSRWDTEDRGRAEGWIAVPTCTMSDLAPRRGPWFRTP